MPVDPITGEIKAQPLNDNFSSLQSEITSHKAETVTGINNVKTGFGAAGDGVTDDTLAIQEAINTAEENGGIVFFPKGRYRITSQLLITKSNVHLVGGGRFNSIIAPDYSTGGDSNIFLVEDGLGGRLENIALSDLGFDGSDSQLSESGPQTRVRFNRVDKLSISRVYGVNTWAFLWVYDSSYFSINDVFLDEQDTPNENKRGAMHIVQSERGIIEGVMALEAGEAVDITQSKDIMVKDVIAYSLDYQDNEVIDVGGSYGITLSNVVGHGFKHGITVKAEAGLGFGDIQIVDCKLFGFYQRGIVFTIATDVDVGEEDRIQNISVKNCTLVSDQINTGLSEPAGLFLDGRNQTSVDVIINNVQVQGNHIDTSCTGIYIKHRTKNIEIANNRIIVPKNTDGHYGIYSAGVSGSLVSDGSIKDNHITGGEDGISNSGILERFRITGNLIEDSQNHGINTISFVRPYIKDNIVCGVGHSGIDLTYSSPGNLDTGALLAEVIIDGNTVIDWGQNAGGGTIYRAIRFSFFFDMGGDSFDMGSISNNRIYITSDAETLPVDSSRHGIVFGTNNGTFDYFKVDDNIILDADSAFSGVSSLGANSTRENNMIR